MKTSWFQNSFRRRRCSDSLDFHISSSHSDGVRGNAPEWRPSWTLCRSQKKRPKLIYEIRSSFIEPMECLPVENIPKGHWIYELKLDGYRPVSVKTGDRQQSPDRFIPVGSFVRSVLTRRDADDQGTRSRLPLYEAVVQDGRSQPTKGAVRRPWRLGDTWPLRPYAQRAQRPACSPQVLCESARPAHRVRGS